LTLPAVGRHRRPRVNTRTLYRQTGEINSSDSPGGTDKEDFALQGLLKDGISLTKK